MPEYEFDPAFEGHLERVLRSFADEAVGGYDVVETTQFAIHGVPRATTRARPAGGPMWLRPLLAAALVMVALLAVGIAGGLIKLTTEDNVVNPSFVPFSPPPLPSSALSPVPGTGAPGTLPPATPGATSVPFTPGRSGLPTPTPDLTPSAEPTPSELPSATPEASPTLEPSATPDATPTLPPEPTDTLEPNVVQVDQGDEHSCALAEGGRIFCWGLNEFGELGDGTRDRRFAANVPVTGIDDAISVATGIRFSCAVLGDGTVSCWGEDSLSDDFMTTPQPVPGVDDAVALTAGGVHACALRRGGTIACWGANQIGQLGNGSVNHDSGVPPQQVLGIDDAVQVSAGWNHTCAVLRGGSIRCWGGSGDGTTHYGALGDGNLANSSSPVAVVGIDNAVQVEAGGWSTCARLEDGSVWCWGYGEQGGLGNGQSTNSSVPVQVSGISDARDIAVGRFHACAQRADGVISCWGDINWGDGADTSVPVDGSATVNGRQLATDRSLLILRPSGTLLEWRFHAGAEPEPVPIGN